MFDEWFQSPTRMVIVAPFHATTDLIFRPDVGTYAQAPIDDRLTPSRVCELAQFGMGGSVCLHLLVEDRPWRAPSWWDLQTYATSGLRDFDYHDGDTYIRDRIKHDAWLDQWHLCMEGTSVTDVTNRMWTVAAALRQGDSLIPDTPGKGLPCAKPRRPFPKHHPHLIRFDD